MTWKRLGFVGCLLAAAILSPSARAVEADEEPAPAQGPEEPEQQPPATPAAGEKKVPWWGGRLALYVEASFGGSSFDEVEPSITTAAGLTSDNRVSLDDNDHGRVAVGWKFPFERGRVLARWSGHRENTYSFTAAGLRNLVQQIGSSNPPSPFNGLAAYWNLSVSGGQLTATRTGWFWNPQTDDKAHGDDPPNGLPDQDEIRPGTWTPSSPDDNTPDESEIQFGAADLQVAVSVPDNLGNRLQTLDLLYERDFGGRRVGGRWRGGLRYFRYEGSLPAAAWVLVSGGFPGDGWTEGLLNPLISLSQDTTGTGPTGSVEIRANFLRRRITLFAQGNVAFLVSDLEVDTGVFTTLVRDPTNEVFFAAPARLNAGVTKSAWQVGAELGIQVEVVRGLTVELAASRTGYLDSLLVPTTITIPSDIQRVFLGTVGVYGTRDIIADAWRFGFGYQF